MAASDFTREDLVQSLALAIATDVKSLATLVNNNAVDNSALTTVNKANLVAAINELDAAIDALSGGGSAESLDDLTDVTLTGPAAGHILRHNGTLFVNVLSTDFFVTPTMLSDAINAVVDAAPGTLDTLNELAAALGDDPNFAATLTSSLAGKQNLDALLTAIAALTTANNQMMYFTGADTVATTSLTAFGRSLIDDADAAAARTTLGVVASSADLAGYYTTARA